MTVVELIAKMWARVAQLNERWECGLACELSLWAYELQATTTWIDVAAALPDDGRRCWVWFRAGNGHEFARLCNFNAREPNNRMFNTVETPESAPRMYGWTALFWQYEIVPANPEKAEPATPPETTGERAVSALLTEAFGPRPPETRHPLQRIKALEAERDRMQARIDERDRGLKRLAADLSATESEAARLRTELASYQLPDDGEPLNLVQRAVAISTGNVFYIRTDGREGRIEMRDDGVVVVRWPDGSAQMAQGIPTGGDAYMSSESRQLTFAEAWKEAEYGPQRVVATTPASLCQYEIHRLAETGPELVVRRANGSTANVRLTYEMLAATWTAGAGIKQ